MCTYQCTLELTLFKLLSNSVVLAYSMAFVMAVYKKADIT